jgi:teichoic acid transport system permease protein
MKNLVIILKDYKDNIYKIFRLSWYDFTLAYRDSYLGLLWAILNPLIQIGVYWFVFGLGIRNSRPINEVAFLPWMLAGIIPWFFLSAAVVHGGNSIYSKYGIISKMKFSISIIPLTAIIEETYNHLVMLIFLILTIVALGYKLNLYSLQLIYYISASVIFLTALAWINSALVMIIRDIQKIIQSLMRLLFYLTPILWSPDYLPIWVQRVIDASPLTYLVSGYRGCLLYNTVFYENISTTVIFWSTTLVLMFIGANLQVTFKKKFIDYI